MQPRAVRVDDETWFAALETAAARGESLSDVIRRAMRGYVKRNKAQASREAGRVNSLGKVWRTP